VRASSVIVSLGRYASAAVAAWVVFVVEGILLYAGLLVAAVIFDEDLGGPLGGLLVVVAAAGLGLLLTGLVCVPAVALGELAGRGRHWWVRGSSALGAAALLLLIYTTAAWIGPVSGSDAVAAWLGALAAVILPTLTCMTVAYGSGWLVTRLARLRPTPGTAVEPVWAEWGR
jgi:hypothetical protein